MIGGAAVGESLGISESGSRGASDGDKEGGEEPAIGQNCSGGIPKSVLEQLTSSISQLTVKQKTRYGTNVTRYVQIQSILSAPLLLAEGKSHNLENTSYSQKKKFQAHMRNDIDSHTSVISNCQSRFNNRFCSV